jgi:hypothetical protein
VRDGGRPALLNVHEEPSVARLGSFFTIEKKLTAAYAFVFADSALTITEVHVRNGLKLQEPKRTEAREPLSAR